MTKTRALGRGIDSLMGSIESKPQRRNSEIPEANVVGSIAEIALVEIEPNPDNPRKEFPEDYLRELSASIKAMGIIQPITVRKLDKGGYQIISGESRFRAAKMAGLKVIPAYIRVATDFETLEMAVTENIQRKDLNPIEIAIHYKALMDGGHLTQEKLSERLGKSRPAVANQLRLLNLPAEIQLALRNGTISMGHAKPLISINDSEKQIIILRKILDKGLSVRQVEELTKDDDNISVATTKTSPSKTISENLAQNHVDLSNHFNTKVQIKMNKSGKGTIVIPFDSAEDLKRIIDMIK